MKMKVGRIRAALDSCRFTRIGDIDAASLLHWLGERRRKGLSIRTSNHILSQFKSFTKWLVLERRTSHDPVAHLKSQNARRDVRRRRQVLSPDGLLKLVEAARGGDAFRGLSGTGRAVLYVVAAYTGLRCKECASLRRKNIDLDAGELRLGAEFTKSGQEARLPLFPSLLPELRSWCAGMEPDAVCFPGTWHRRSADMVKIDLAAASLPYQDADGRYLDFHAFRHTFITWVSRGNTTVDQLVGLSRHADASTTLDNYVHAQWTSLTEAVERLPALPQEGVRSRGGAPKQEWKQECRGGVEGHLPASDGNGDGSARVAEDRRNSSSGKSLALAVTSGHAEAVAIPGGLEPPTCGLGNRCLASPADAGSPADIESCTDADSASFPPLTPGLTPAAGLHRRLLAAIGALDDHDASDLIRVTQAWPDALPHIRDTVLLLLRADTDQASSDASPPEIPF